MKKIVILLTVLLFLLIAFTPQIVGTVQDHAILNQTSFGEIKVIELDFTDRQRSLSMVERLALLGQGKTVDITESQATMTTEEVFAAVEREMAYYEEAGIFRWFKTMRQTAVPKLAVDGSDVNRFLVYWTVTYINKNDPSRSLVLDLDDETGKILAIRYEEYDSYSMDGVWERNRALMDAFTGIYFSRLEITPPDCVYYQRDGGVSSALYRFDGFNMEFFAEGAGGFYLYFLE